MDRYRSANQALWNEWTTIHAHSDAYDLESFKTGHNALHPLEMAELGDVRGKRLLHLMCHFGMDSLSWVHLGAQVTGVDFSERAIDLASSLSRELNLPARFICSDVYDLPAHLDEQFDIVYTTYGVLAWLADLPAWANIAARFLKPGGVFYLADFHPLSLLFEEVNGELRLAYLYFDEQVMEVQTEGSYVDRSAPVAQKVNYQWTYTLGGVVSALADAGLHIQFLHEFPFSTFQMQPSMVKGDDRYWRLPGDQKKMPLLFSIRAVKE
jgi:SAM-dependent methyltransferase